MAEESSPLKVVYHERADKALIEIWNWNATEYGAVHADQYIAFLRERTGALDYNHGIGSRVSTRPEFRYIVIRRSSRGHGHIAIYRVNEETVQIMEFFHTAQDWESYVEDAEYL